MRFIVYIGLLLSILAAQEISLETPEEAVKSYYYAMNHADLDSLEKIMVKSSFDMSVDVWALSIALKDRDFHKILKQYGSDSKVDQKVKEVVRKKLQATPAKTISELESTMLGTSRCMIRYKENSHAKQLFTSLHGNLWKIDYKAGRKID